MAIKAKKKNKSHLREIPAAIKNFVISTHGFPISLVITIVLIMFVVFRMKAVEQDYQYSSLMKKIEKHMIENRELKAKKAGLLSVKNLRKIARNHKMQEPKQRQIIVIP